MQRRDLLRAIGAAAALAVLPEHDAFAAWARVASGGATPGVLTNPDLALIGAIADTLLPRTSSPSATDVGVPAFIDVIVSEQYTERDRNNFTSGLAAVATQLNGETAFAGLEPAARGAKLEALEALTDRRADPARTYWRLKGLVLHGYFTSEKVMKDVLHYQVMPGQFRGNAPMRAS
jgi:hypothetical protein